jgi:hypothetical protein
MPNKQPYFHMEIKNNLKYLSDVWRINNDFSCRANKSEARKTTVIAVKQGAKPGFAHPKLLAAVLTKAQESDNQPR